MNSEHVKIEHTGGITLLSFAVDWHSKRCSKRCTNRSTYWYSNRVIQPHFLMKFNNSSFHSLFGVEIQIVATQQPLIGIG